MSNEISIFAVKSYRQQECLLRVFVYILAQMHHNFFSSAVECLFSGAVGTFAALAGPGECQKSLWRAINVAVEHRRQIVAVVGRHGLFRKDPRAGLFIIDKQLRR